MRRRLSAASEAGEVAVEPRAVPAPDVSSQRVRRFAGLAGLAVLPLVFLVGFVGGVRSLFAQGDATLPTALHGPTVEARMTDLASGCVRDAANFDESADPDAQAVYRDRLSHCFVSSELVGQVWDGSGSQAASEPQASVTARSKDGLSATVVVRLRVSGDPLPTFRYYTVDVGCRRDGVCLLTSVPIVVSDLEGDR
jgi:hypothetical protein